MADSSNPPLFLHDGVYTAKLDRALIGSLLAPGGDGNYPMNPRAGVRPHYLNDAGVETSLMVVAQGTGVIVQPGVALVKGAVTDDVSAVYLVVNPAPLPVALPAPIPGLAKNVMVAVMVTDSLGDPAPDPAQGTWTIGYYEGAAPSTSFTLPLALVTIPGTVGANIPPPDDKRQYTSALGGSFKVSNASDLNTNVPRLPYGSLAYAYDTDMMYTRSKNGWVQNPAIATFHNTASLGGITGHQNELLWNSQSMIMYIYDKSKWIPITRTPTSVATLYETTFPDGPDTAATSAINTSIKVPAGNWFSINHAAVTTYIQNDIKPDVRAVGLQARAESPSAPLHIRFGAAVTINKLDTDGTSIVPDLTNQFWIGIEVYQSANPLQSTPKDDDPTVFSDIIDLRAVNEPFALTWTTTTEGKLSSFVEVPASQGDYFIRPMFKATNEGYFAISNLFVEVTSI